MRNNICLKQCDIYLWRGLEITRPQLAVPFFRFLLDCLTSSSLFFLLFSLPLLSSPLPPLSLLHSLSLARCSLLLQPSLPPCNCHCVGGVRLHITPTHSLPFFPSIHFLFFSSCFLLFLHYLSSISQSSLPKESFSGIYTG